MKKSILIIVLLSLAQISFAGEYRRQFQDYRSLAMGNTGVASSNGSATLFFNPAALSNITEGYMDVLGVQAIYTPEIPDYLSDVMSGDFLQTRDDQIDFMNDNMGNKIYLQADIGVHAFANIDKKGLTVGGNYLLERIIDINVQNPAIPEIEVFERYDQIKAGGFSYPIGLGQFVLGIGYKSIIRKERAFTYSVTDALADEDFPTIKANDIADGSSDVGAGWDLGFLFRFATPYKVVLGGVYRSEVTMSDATTIPATYDLGVTMAHEFGIFKWVLAIDVRDIGQELGSEGDTSWARRAHAGMELGMFPISDMNYLLTARGGYSQGYLSYGGEFRLGELLVVGLARYSEEVGEYAGDSENKRTALYVKLGF